MRAFLFLGLSYLILASACKKTGADSRKSNDAISAIGDGIPRQEITEDSNYLARIQSKALVATHFNSLEEFKAKVKIQYKPQKTKSDSSVKGTSVTLSFSDQQQTVISILRAGTSQKDITNARDGGILNQIGLVFQSPYSIRNRRDMSKIYMLARRRPAIFGEGDVAFYDLALSTMMNITTEELAYQNPKDSSEKGYINTFNHITAQAFISTIFSEEMADFIADLHERHSMPELTSGLFTQKQLNDTVNYPVDNYVDMINNEIGQELGILLKKKHLITTETRWTAQLLTDYLNDLQYYYSWALGIGLSPFRVSDDLIRRFSKKINIVMKGGPFYIE